MSKSIRTVAAVVAFVIANLALAAIPADAGWQNTYCENGDGGPTTVYEQCCKKCVFFCRCDLF